MKEKSDDALVPAEQKQLLDDFRASHPYTEIETAGKRWRYIACGQGKRTLLLLPGAFLPADMWFQTILALESSYRMIAPDAYPLQGWFDLEQVCSAILHSLDRENVVKAVVIGLSAGGGLAQYLLQKQPERVAHAVFSHCGLLESDPQAQRKGQKLLTLARLLPAPVVRWALVRLTSGHAPADSDWLEFHNAYFRQAAASIDKTAIVNFLQMGLEMRRSWVWRPDALESWPGQVLILASQDDQLTMSSLAKLQARYPAARTHLFERGGHHTFMLFPRQYTETIARFLEQVE